MVDRKKTQPKEETPLEEKTKKKKKGNTSQIRLPRQLVHDLKKVAAHKDCEIADLIVPTLIPIVAAELEMIRLEMNKKAAEKSDKS